METAPPVRRRVLVWLILTQAMGALSLLPWLMFAGLSVMAFDAPGSDRTWQPWLFVGAIWSWPLVLVVLSGGAWLLFRAGRYGLAALVTALPGLPAAGLVLFLVASVLFG